MVTVTPGAIHISFILSDPHPREDKEGLAEVASSTVRLSRSKAKSLSMILEQVVRDWETRYGEIPLGEGMAEVLQDIKAQGAEDDNEP